MRAILSRTILSLLILLATAPAWAGKILVLESDNAEGFVAGGTFDGSGSISVASGARLALMDERGVAITIKGPYTGIPGGGERSTGPSFLDRLAAIVKSPTAADNHPVLGATRAMTPVAVLPNMLALDVSATGSACVQSASNTVLWRPLPRPATTVTLARRSTSAGTPTSRPWPAGDATLPWPSELPLEEGLSYLVTLGTSNTQHILNVHVAPATDSDVATLDWMAGASCTAQAKALLADMGQRKIIEGRSASSAGLFE